MIVNAVVAATRQAAGTQAQLRAGQDSDLIVSTFQAQYAEAVRLGKVFSVANQTGIATTVGLATTYTGLALCNPLGSGVNLVLLKVAAAFPVAVAAGVVVGVMVGYSAGTNVTHTAAIAPRSNLVGTGAAGLALADTSCTFPTAPTLQKVIGTIGTAAITAMSIEPAISEDFEGSIILPPGAYAAFYTSTVSGALGFVGSFKWMEIAV